MRLMHRTNHSALGVAFGVWVSAGISGGHVNPAVKNQLTWHRSHSDSMADHCCFSCLSRISLEEGSNLHSCTNFGRHMRRGHYICELLPCDQRCGRWSLYQNCRQVGRPICSLLCANSITMSAGDRILTQLHTTAQHPQSIFMFFL